MRIKSKGTRQVLATVVCGLVLGAVPTFAQSAATTQAAGQDQTTQAPEHHGPRHGEEHRIEHMTKELNLTPDQVSQIKAIDVASREQMRTVHEDASLQPADKHAKMMTIRQDSESKVRAVLTEDQKPKFDAMVERMKEKHEQHRGEQGPPPPPPAQ